MAKQAKQVRSAQKKAAGVVVKNSRKNPVVTHEYVVTLRNRGAKRIADRLERDYKEARG